MSAADADKEKTPHPAAANANPVPSPTKKRKAEPTEKKTLVVLDKEGGGNAHYLVPSALIPAFLTAEFVAQHPDHSTDDQMAEVDAWIQAIAPFEQGSNRGIVSGQSVNNIIFLSEWC
jgi:hypothetical protein